MISFAEYQLAAARTALIDPENIPFTRIVMALGLNGEAGEVGETVKKEVAHGHPENLEKVKEELGDVLWYLAGLATVYGILLQDVAEFNIAKLEERYPGGFSTEASIDRVDRKGLTVVE